MVISACEHKINDFGAIKKFVGAFFQQNPPKEEAHRLYFHSKSACMQSKSAGIIKNHSANLLMNCKNICTFVTKLNNLTLTLSDLWIIP